MLSSVAKCSILASLAAGARVAKHVLAKMESDVSDVKEVTKSQGYCCGYSKGQKVTYLSSTSNTWQESGPITICGANSVHATSSTPPYGRKEYTCNVVSGASLLQAEERKEGDRYYCCGYQKGEEVYYQSSTTGNWQWSGEIELCGANSVHAPSGTAPYHRKEISCNVVSLLEETQDSEKSEGYCCGFRKGQKVTYRSSTNHQLQQSGEIELCGANSVHAPSGTYPHNRKEYTCNVVQGASLLQEKEESNYQYCCGYSVGQSGVRYRSSTDNTIKYSGEVMECGSNYVDAYSATPPGNRKRYNCGVVSLMQETEESKYNWCCGYSEGQTGVRYRSSTDNTIKYSGKVMECGSNYVDAYSATKPYNRKRYDCGVVSLMQETEEGHCCGKKVGDRVYYQSSTDQQWKWSGKIALCGANSVHAPSATPPYHRKEYKCGVLSMMQETEEVTKSQGYCCGKSVGQRVTYMSSTYNKLQQSGPIELCGANSVHAPSATPPYNRKEYTCNVVSSLMHEAEETKEGDRYYCCGYSKGDSVYYQSSTNHQWQWSGPIELCGANSVHAPSATPPYARKEYSCNVVSLLEETKDTGYCCGYAVGQTVRYQSSTDHTWKTSGKIELCGSDSLHAPSATYPHNRKEYRCNVVSLLQEAEEIKESKRYHCCGYSKGDSVYYQSSTTHQYQWSGPIELCGANSVHAPSGTAPFHRKEISCNVVSLLQETEEQVEVEGDESLVQVESDATRTEGSCLCYFSRTWGSNADYTYRAHHCNWAPGGHDRCVCGTHSKDWRWRSTQC